MDWEVILKAAGLVTFGSMFIWLGLDGWKHRREDRVSLIEATILKSADEAEQLPFSRYDRMMAYIQPVLMLVFGPVMIFIAIILLVS